MMNLVLGISMFYSFLIIISADRQSQHGNFHHSCQSDSDCYHDHNRRNRPRSYKKYYPMECCMTVICNINHNALGDRSSIRHQQYFMTSSGCIAAPNPKRKCGTLGRRGIGNTGRFAARIKAEDWFLLEPQIQNSCTKAKELIPAQLFSLRRQRLTGHSSHFAADELLKSTSSSSSKTSRRPRTSTTTTPIPSAVDYSDYYYRSPLGEQNTAAIPRWTVLMNQNRPNESPLFASWPDIFSGGRNLFNPVKSPGQRPKTPSLASVVSSQQLIVDKYYSLPKRPSFPPLDLPTPTPSIRKDPFRLTNLIPQSGLSFFGKPKSASNLIIHPRNADNLKYPHNAGSGSPTTLSKIYSPLHNHQYYPKWTPKK